MLEVLWMSVNYLIEFLYPRNDKFNLYIIIISSARAGQISQKMFSFTNNERK